MSEPPIVTATVKQFKELSGFGATTVYKMMSNGDIRSVKIGRRRLIILSSWYDLINRQADCSPLFTGIRREPPPMDGAIDGKQL